MKTKTAKVVILPTDKVTDIIVPGLGVCKGQIHHKEYYGSAQLDMADRYQHLYFLSDEDIKEGDWFYDEDIKEVRNDDYIGGINIKKIIATTDSKLGDKFQENYLYRRGRVNKPDIRENAWREVIKNQVPQIPNQFIKAYAEQGGIDEVTLECEEYIDYVKAIHGATKLKLTGNNEVVVCDGNPTLRLSDEAKKSSFFTPRGDEVKEVKNFIELYGEAKCTEVLSKWTTTKQVEPTNEGVNKFLIDNHFDPKEDILNTDGGCWTMENLFKSFIESYSLSHFNSVSLIERYSYHQENELNNDKTFRNMVTNKWYYENELCDTIGITNINSIKLKE